MPDPINDTADDWQMASLIGLAGAVGGGAGIMFFAIRSERLQSFEPMIFCAAGLGLGGNASGVPYETFRNAMSRRDLAFSDLVIHTPFSIRMLHTSAGIYAGASVGIPVANFGWSRLTAENDGRVWFTSSGPGASVGSGTGAVAMAGIWYSYRLNGNSINPIPAYERSLTDSLEEFVGGMERGIRQIYGAPYL